MVAEVEVRVVDPDRVGERARARGAPAGGSAGTNEIRSPISRDQRVVVEARVARVEDLDRGVVPRRGRRLGGEEGEVARAAAARSSLTPVRSSRLVPHGILTEALRRAGPSVARKATTHAPIWSPPSRSPCSLPLTLGACGSGDQLVGAGAASRPRSSTITFTGDDVTPNGDRIDVEVGQPIELDVTADEPGEIHVHSSPRAGVRVQGRHQHASTVKPIQARAWSRSSRTRSRRSSFIARGRTVTAAPVGGAAPPARPRRRAGPADLARAGDPRRRGRGRGLLRRARPGLAHARGTTPPPAAGPLRPGSRRSSTRAVVARSPAAWSACSRLLYLVVVAVLGKDLLINPIFGIFYVWIWVGVSVASLLFGRVWKAISPFRLINAGLARVSGGDPDERRVHLPRAARACGRPRSASTRSSGWSWSTPTTSTSAPVRLWCAVYLGADDHRRRAVREHVLRAGRPVRGLLLAWSPGCRSGVAATGSWCSAARWPTSTPPRRPPGWSAVVAVLFGSTAFDAFRDSTRWLTFIQGTGYSTYLQNNLGLLGFCLAVGADLLRSACMAPASGRSSRARELPDPVRASR